MGGALGAAAAAKAGATAGKKQGGGGADADGGKSAVDDLLRRAMSKGVKVERGPDGDDWDD